MFQNLNYKLPRRLSDVLPNQQAIKCCTVIMHLRLLWFPIKLSLQYFVLLRHTGVPRALPLQNLVSGYECARVFPAGVGPGSPSRDAANWLSSLFGSLVETRRRYGWLTMVFPGTRLFRGPIWRPSGGWRHAKGREHCPGELGSALSGGYAPVSAKAEGSSIVDEPGEG